MTENIYISQVKDILINNNMDRIQIDLSSCKNWSECMKVIELITSGRVKIKVNEQHR